MFALNSSAKSEDRGGAVVSISSVIFFQALSAWSCLVAYQSWRHRKRVCMHFICSTLAHPHIIH